MKRSTTLVLVASLFAAACSSGETATDDDSSEASSKKKKKNDGPVFTAKVMGIEKSLPLVDTDLSSAGMPGFSIKAPEGAQVKKSRGGVEVVEATVNYSIAIRDYAFNPSTAKTAFAAVDPEGKLLEDSAELVMFQRKSGSVLFSAAVEAGGTKLTCGSRATAFDFDRATIEQTVASCKTLTRTGGASPGTSFVSTDLSSRGDAWKGFSIDAPKDAKVMEDFNDCRVAGDGLDVVISQQPDHRSVAAAKAALEKRAGRMKGSVSFENETAAGFDYTLDTPGFEGERVKRDSFIMVVSTGGTSVGCFPHSSAGGMEIEAARAACKTLKTSGPTTPTSESAASDVKPSAPRSAPKPKKPKPCTCPKGDLMCAMRCNAK